MAIIIYGKNAVRESLKVNRVEKLYVQDTLKEDELFLRTKKSGIKTEFRDKEQLTRMAKNPSHQGFVAICKEVRPLTLDELLTRIDSPEPLLLMLDGIEDPHNFGAILRTCDALGIDGVIYPSHRAVALNSTVYKVSTGAINYVNIAEVNNLSRTIERLKKEGYWIVSADGEGTTDFRDVDYHGPICLITGSEGFGISKNVLKNSDFIVKIPMKGHVNSLNVSVATAILLSHIVFSR